MNVIEFSTKYYHTVFFEWYNYFTTSNNASSNSVLQQKIMSKLCKATVLLSAIDSMKLLLNPGVIQCSAVTTYVAYVSVP